jgi:hypothetical protein
MVIGVFAYQVIFHITTVITVIVQGYAIFAVQTQSPTNLKKYRPFLNFFSLWDIMFTIFYGIFLVPDPIGSRLMCRSRGISVFIGPEAQLLSVYLD